MSRGFYSKEILNYVKEKILDQVHAAGIDTLVMIPPYSLGLATTSTKRWSESIVSDPRFTVKTVKNLQACEDWLQFSMPNVAEA